MGITLSKIYGHFKTITKHRHLVIAHGVKAGIFWQTLFHDLSKYSPSEFWVGAKYYQGDRSPNEEERRDCGYSSAWLHHKGRNRHHFEYWFDYNIETREYTPVPMPKRYIAEMFCDRVAASKIYQGKNYTDRHPLDYFNRGVLNRPIHPETSKIIEDLLSILANSGEEAAFRKIRRMLKSK